MKFRVVQKSDRVHKPVRLKNLNILSDFLRIHNLNFECDGQVRLFYPEIQEHSSSGLSQPVSSV